MKKISLEEAVSLYVSSKINDFEEFLKENEISISTDFPNETLPENPKEVIEIGSIEKDL
jgi:hypothetical protein